MQFTLRWIVVYDVTTCRSVGDSLDSENKHHRISSTSPAVKSHNFIGKTPTFSLANISGYKKLKEYLPCSKSFSSIKNILKFFILLNGRIVKISMSTETGNVSKEIDKLFI